MSKIRLPIVGELVALLREVGIMYDNSASLRKSGLIATFDVAARVGGSGGPGAGPVGGLIDIASSPYAAPDFFAHSVEWPQRAARVPAALSALDGMTRDEWKAEAKFSSSVATSLSKLGVATSARVLRHAYTLASVNLSVILDYPLLPIPSLAEFEEVCR